jgi:hypothetical protein
MVPFIGDMLHDFCQEVKRLEHFEISGYSRHQCLVTRDRKRKAICVRCPIENLAIFCQGNHSPQRKRAAGDVLDEALHAGLITTFDAYGIVNAEPGVFPAAHACGDLIVYLMLVKKKGEYPFLPELHGTILEDIGDVNEVSRIGKNALCDERMDVRVKIDKRSVCLHGPDHGRNAAVRIDLQRVNVPHGLPRFMAELTE